MTSGPANNEGTCITVKPVSGPLIGRLTLPGSKSITNRALLLGSLANGTSRLTGALKSDDTLYMAKALRQMGVTIEEPDETTFIVTGQGQLVASRESLFLGNAGTATRFLVAASANIDGTTVINGDTQMRKRPIAPLVDALKNLGVDIWATDGCPPVIVNGHGGMKGAHVVIDASLSSQYVSALLMTAACGRGKIEIELAGGNIGGRGYIDLTVSAMRRFGASVERPNETVWCVKPTGYQPTDFAIEPDASAATYIWAAQALTGGSIDIGLAPNAFSQPDAASYRLISQFPRMPSVIDGSQMQDAVPTLAVLAAFNERPVRFTGIANLRVKECDRIAALATELNRIRWNLAVEEGNDLIVHSDPSLAGQSIPTRIETYSDHRIAMAFALAGLLISGIAISDPGCVAKTYPQYWEALASLGAVLELTK